ncbi:MAG: phospho-N-acetylmuramoyl-pentapeptide-transferase [Minisyncoccia bacterium]
MANEIFLNIIKICFLGLVSFLISLSIFPFLLSLLFKLNLSKVINKESSPIFQSLHKKKEGTPTMGGIIFWLTPIVFLLLVIIISVFDKQFANWINFLNKRETYLPLGFMILGGLIGLIDDLLGMLKIRNFKGLRIKDKLIIYFAFSILVSWWFMVKLGIRFLYIPFLGRTYLNFFLILLFLIFYIISVSFSANETDGLDGLLAGVSISIIFALMVFSFLNGDYNLTALSAIVIGSILCFLWFNVYPAKIFMGDTGSMALGSYIAIVSLLEGTYFLIPIIAPIFVLESGSVILQVLSKKIFKKKIFLSTPIHHHFEALGMHESNIVFKFWILNIAGAVLGIIIFILDKFI